jgi:hypothetical protein
VKVKIEAKPGEVDESKLPDLVKSIHRMVAGEDLAKAHDHDEADLAPLIPVLKEAVARSGLERNRIQEVLLRKLLAVVGE